MASQEVAGVINEQTLELIRIVGFGIAGGFLVELFQWYSIRQTMPNRLPKYFKSWFYWSITCAMILSGGFLTYLYTASGVTLNAQLAFHIGASAPLILGKFVKTAVEPKID